MKCARLGYGYVFHDCALTPQSGRKSKGSPRAAHLSAGKLVQKIIDRRVDELTRRVWKAHPGNAYLRSTRRESVPETPAQAFEERMRPVRRRLRLLHLVEALCDYVLPALVSNCPSVTRKDVVALLAATWPASRGTEARKMFDPKLVRAAHAALMREHAHWGSRAAVETLADRLMVTPRTIQAHLRIPTRKKQ